MICLLFPWVFVVLNKKKKKFPGRPVTSSVVQVWPGFGIWAHVGTHSQCDEVRQSCLGLVPSFRPSLARTTGEMQPATTRRLGFGGRAFRDLVKDGRGFGVSGDLLQDGRGCV